MDGLNDQSLLDVRKLITGKDGRLFVTTKKGTNLFLAEVDTFQAQLSPANTDYQPVGSALVYAVNTGYTVTLTLTEAVVRDNVMISELITDLQHGYFPSFDFQGKMRRRDGQTERVVYRNCVPDGSIDLQNLNPGEIIKRAWSFRVNATPEMLEQFKEAEWRPIE
ncbi:MAG: phage tail tube protein [Oscillospiraceae bacterium]|nr:phage tail tube protein [Oscillospiraceae bacterium]